MKEKIIECLARHSWAKDRFLDFFNKEFETALTQKTASIWLRYDRECDRWWLANGDFTSAGQNVLAGCCAFFPVDMTENEIEAKVDAFVAEMESWIERAWSVRLFRRWGKMTSSTCRACA